MKKIVVLFFLLILIVNVSAIAYSKKVFPTFSNPQIIINPYEKSPLTAIVKFETEEPTEITIRIYGKDNFAHIVHTISGFNTQHEIPLLGLYAGQKTKVDLIARTKNGTDYMTTIYPETSKIGHRGLFFVKQSEKKQNDFWFFTDGIVLDENGDIRFNFYAPNQAVYFLSGELIVENRALGLERYSLLGKLLKKYPFPTDFTSFSHGIAQKDNKNFLVIGSFANSTAVINGNKVKTQRDYIIEIDYTTGAMLHSWDLGELLNPNRTALVQAEATDYGLNDFCHLNSVQYIADDKSIICSCRNFGVFKIDTLNNKLKWIISPNVGLDKSGRSGTGKSLENKVLTAIDSNGKILSETIQKGYAKHDFFKWPTSTHHARFWGKGLISIYDNSGPVYDKKLVTTLESLASVYRIDEKNKTIMQLLKIPQECFSAEASAVLVDTDNREITTFTSRCFDKAQIGLAIGYL